MKHLFTPLIVLSIVAVLFYSGPQRTYACSYLAPRVVDDATLRSDIAYRDLIVEARVTSVSDVDRQVTARLEVERVYKGDPTRTMAIPLNSPQPSDPNLARISSCDTRLQVGTRYLFMLDENTGYIAQLYNTFEMSTVPRGFASTLERVAPPHDPRADPAPMQPEGPADPDVALWIYALAAAGLLATGAATGAGASVFVRRRRGQQ